MKIIVIGGGVAGLTAVYKLIDEDINQEHEITLVEMENRFGGISATLESNGNKIDIGGHRFFTKDESVKNLWFDILGKQGALSKEQLILGIEKTFDKKYIKHNMKSKTPIEVDTIDPELSDDVFLERDRLSRIYFLNKFFDYPVTLSFNTIKNLGIVRMCKIGFTYICAKLFPKKEDNLENFFINRFGKELYLTFFKDYTEKLWGLPCSDISADWGAQRVKGLSVTEVLKHAFLKIFNKSSNETSLIERFYYPKYGPGHLYSKMAEIITDNGCNVIVNNEVVNVLLKDNTVTGVKIRNLENNEEIILDADIVISTMPIKDLFESINEEEVPREVRDVALNLHYRDFMTCGILLNKLAIQNNTNIKTINNLIPDTWVYVQDKGVKLGRIQIFNNWSPYLVNDINNVWIGLEYFVSEGDELWNSTDDEFIHMATQELEKIGFANASEIIDTCVLRIKKAYPIYDDIYQNFDVVKDYINSIPNLYAIGRNGMHRYNNMDHSMLTAMKTVDSIFGRCSKDDIWNVNTEKDYHEEKDS